MVMSWLVGTGLVWSGLVLLVICSFLRRAGLGYPSSRKCKTGHASRPYYSVNTGRSGRKVSFYKVLDNFEGESVHFYFDGLVTK